ncbi:MAG: hypothetical protein ABW002_08850 [Xanthomonas sp.]
MDKPLIVTLEAAFAGLTFLPWFAWAHNSLNPTLILHADHVQYRVLRTRTRPYREIARVDYRKAWGNRERRAGVPGSEDDLHREQRAAPAHQRGHRLLAAAGMPALRARAGLAVTAKRVAPLRTARRDPSALRLTGYCFARLLLRACQSAAPVAQFGWVVVSTRDRKQKPPV